MSKAPTLAQISGIAYPSPKILALATSIHGRGVAKRLSQIMDDTVAVDALARLLTEAIEKKTTKDGRIDMRDVAAHVLSEMKGNPR